MRRNKHTQTTLRIKGVGLVEVVTITGLAHIIGKSRTTILRYEREEIFPSAPIVVMRHRYYPLTLAKRLVPLVMKIPGYKKPDVELIVEINKVFKEEKSKLICRQE